MEEPSIATGRASQVLIMAKSMNEQPLPASGQSSLPSIGRTAGTGKRRRVVSRGLAVAALAVLGVLGLSYATAQAAIGHAFATTFGAATNPLPSPANPYPLASPTGIAVDNSSGPSAGDLYVVDGGNRRVEKFGPSGEFILMFGGEVDLTTGGGVCTAASQDICKAGTEGSSPGEFRRPSFVAVDNSDGPSSGDVYVGDELFGTVSKFDPSGHLVASWGAGGQLNNTGGGGSGIAVDSHGNLFTIGETQGRWYDPTGQLHSVIEVPTRPTVFGLTVDSEGYLYHVNQEGELTKYNNAGGLIGNPDTLRNAIGAGVNPVTDDLYVLQGRNGGYVGHYAAGCNQSCLPRESFGSGDLTAARGVSIDSTSGAIYVTDEGANDVAVFNPRTVPGIISEPPSGLTSESAILRAHIDSAGLGDLTGCLVEFGLDASYGQTEPCSPSPPYTDPTDVSVELTGLQIAKTYHYRVVVSNSSGSYQGPDQIVRTIGVPIHSFSVTPSTTQAGGHPDIETSLTYDNRFVQEFPNNCFCQDARNIKTSLPAGVIGDPHAVPQCTRLSFGEGRCSPSTQLGVARIKLFERYAGVAVYNLEPNPDQAGVLGFFIPTANTPGFIVFSARTGGDFGLDATVTGVEHLIPPEGFKLDLWGIPAAASHEAERAPIGVTNCGIFSEFTCFPPTPSNAELRPFLDNPTTCSEPLEASLEILAYDHGLSTAKAPYPATTGCDQLSFNPSLHAQPTTTQTDSASGLDIDLSVPQPISPAAPSPSEIRALTVTLPKGISINPNAADGKTSCSDVQARIGTEEEAQCPEISKIGAVSLTSAALPAPITGSAFIGEPEPGDRYRLILTANGFDTHVKLIGSVEPGSKSGQLVVSFPNLPQSPFSEFHLHFFGSERGLLATPTQCGTYSVESTFTPWDSALSQQTSTQYFTLDKGPDGQACPGSVRPFGPSFTAGGLESTAGAHDPLSLQVGRADGDQNLAGLTITTPPGFLATLNGVPYCSDSALAAAAAPGYSGLFEQIIPSCPTASQIGAATAAAGAGTHPVYLSGKVFLAGPYKGAPLSLAVITPAVSGPYDLGNVVVRAALRVDPRTAQITTVSDPLPQILEGIPLRLRSIRIDLDRPNFTLNPTNCSPFSLNAEIFGDQGAVATPSAHFQVANCRNLPFAPKFSTRVSGSTHHTGNPALTASVTAKPGEANLASTTVTLPHSEFLDNAHIKSPCTRVQFSANQCPSASLLGYAKAETPLLEKALEGPVYLRANGGERKLPDIAAALRGQININLVGFVESVHGHIRTTFDTIPDAPISKFTLSLYGGKKGLLVNSTDLCTSTQRVSVMLTGQNGKTADENSILATPCSHKKAKNRHKGHKKAGVHR